MPLSNKRRAFEEGHRRKFLVIVDESPEVDAVLVQLPLADHMDEGGAMCLLHPDKDVDGFHPLNMG